MSEQLKPKWGVPLLNIEELERVIWQNRFWKLQEKALNYKIDEQEEKE